MKQKRQITIEQHSITIIRASIKTFSTHCESCQKESAGLPPKEVSIFMSKPLPEIFQKIEAGELHLTNNRLALICKHSIERSLNIYQNQ